MTHLDDELRHVLSRREPPPGFAERVLRRAAEDQSNERHRQRWSFVRWAAAAALVGAVAGGVEYQAVLERRAERARGEAAKEQVLEALRIAGSKLQIVQEKVREIGS